MDSVRHPHAHEQVADARHERVVGLADDADGLDLGVGHGRAPVRQQLGDRGVELLVANPAGEHQVRVELPERQRVAKDVPVAEEALERRDDDALGAGHVG
ncbi:MAG: hypothetical protein U0R65_11975 [Candidatus Nanopelagicales bacterium]